MQRQPPAGNSTRAFRRLGKQTALAGALLTLAGAAWVLTDLRMAGMDAGPGTDPGALGFYLSTWVVMMAAMMLPSITPAVLSYSELKRERKPEGRTASIGATGLFLGGYLAVWGLAGLAGYVVLEAGRTLDGGVLGWDRAGRFTAAGVLLAATLYQLTPAKSACLAQCRGARAVRLAKRGENRHGALRSGIRYGVWC
ncbi:MAG TPA: DUF2182 domain-containing protein, partial [Solirubrobacteraceae bacterium]